MSSLREQIVGAWELIQYYAYSVDDESNKVYPMGENVQGIIMYTPDGYMSAQLLTPGQKPFDENRSGGPEADWATVGRRFVGYTGHFFLDETGDAQGRPILMHHMRTSSSPSLLGDTQRRMVRITEEGDGRHLNLGLEEPIDFKDGKRVVVVRWRRLPDNSKGTTPPAKGEGV
jgi:hypothetical protein